MEGQALHETAEQWLREALQQQRQQPASPAQCAKIEQTAMVLTCA